MKTGKKLSVLVLILSFGALLVSGCSQKSDTVTIGGKTFTEQKILTHMIGILLKENTDVPIKVVDNIGETSTLHSAYKKGDIDIYTEYSGAAYQTILKHTYEKQSSKEIYDTVSKEYDKKYNATWTKSLGFENTYVLAVNSRNKDLAYLKTYSQLARESSKYTIGAPHAFFDREDGYNLLEDGYNFAFKDKVKLDTNVLYTALKNNEVDVITAFSTDPELLSKDVIALKDTKHVFPSYDLGIVMRNKTLKKYPKIEDECRRLEGSITEKDMQKMISSVVNDHKTPESVARTYLKSKNFIK